MKEFFELLWLNLKTTFFSLIEYLKVIFCYYQYPSFCKSDIALLSIYLFDNPFTISKRFHKNRGDKEIYVYGETPLTTLDLILKQADILPEETIFELGSGRGRTCFWINGVLKQKCVGIEEIPAFIDRALRVKEKQKLSRIEFRCENMLDSDFSKGSVFYLYGNFLEDEALEKIARKFKKGDKVITVSFPISDYDKKNSFHVLKQFPAPFTWGWGDVYVSIKN